MIVIFPGLVSIIHPSTILNGVHTTLLVVVTVVSA